MSSFTEGAFWPSSEYTRQGLRVYIVTRGFRFGIGSADSPWFVDVPTGRKTDLASVPRWARSFIAEDQMVLSGAVHDEMRKSFPLWLGNLVFLHAMNVEGTSFFSKWIAFAAVWFNRRRD